MRGTKERLAAVFHFARIRWPADQNEPPVAIAAIYRAALINFQPDPRMAKSRGHVCSTAVAGNAVCADKDGFWRVDHAERLAKASGSRNDVLY